MRRYRRNYKKEYGITLKEAKQLCIANNGKLPRIGYVMTVKEDPGYHWTYNGRYYGKCTVQFNLVNNSGSFDIYTYVSQSDCIAPIGSKLVKD